MVMLMGKMEYCCLGRVQGSPLRHPASSSGAQSASSSPWLLVLIPQLPSLHPSATRVQVLPESHLSCLFSVSGLSGALTGSVLDALLGPLNILVTAPLPLPVVMQCLRLSEVSNSHGYSSLCRVPSWTCRHSLQLFWLRGMWMGLSGQRAGGGWLWGVVSSQALGTDCRRGLLCPQPVNGAVISLACS